MKKLFIIGFISIALFSQTFSTFQLSEKEKESIKKLAYTLEQVVNQSNPSAKNLWNQKIKRILDNTQINSKKYVFLSELLSYSRQMDLSKYQKNHYNQYKINENSIKDFWLGLHNSSRNDKGLSNYSYDKRLDNTAIEWSYSNYEKKSLDHKRNYNDGWYDYTTIENWFQERGVNCKVKGGTTTSESIGKFGYYCRDNDCTEEMKESLKDIYNIYIGEELLPYPQNAHYLAIVSPHISEIGLGISIYKSDLPAYYEYYLTTHYCTEFK